MTLQTEYTKINTQFPVSGKDNSAEGFRNNFAYIKNSLGYASADITALQQLQGKTETVLSFNSTDIDVLHPIVVNDSEYQTISISADLFIPLVCSETAVDEKFYKTRLDIINISTGQRAISFDNSVKSSVQLPILLEAGEHTVIECWTIDNGVTWMISSLGKFTTWS